MRGGDGTAGADLPERCRVVQGHAHGARRAGGDGDGCDHGDATHPPSIPPSSTPRVRTGGYAARISAADLAASAEATAADPRARWYREVAMVALFYGLYTLVRDLNDSDSVAPALRHAHQMIGLERALHVFDEAWVQHLVVHDRPFMKFWDGYYGTVHFVAVIAVLVGLFARHPVHYRRWRNTLAATTLLGLIGFWVYPLMPPRLLPGLYGFTDTLRTVGGLWDFRSGAINAVSNQYAAMPSLHTAWSLWCALALWSCVPRARLRPLLLVYPAATIFCIVATANHYFADAAAGVVTLAAGYGVALLAERAVDRRRLQRAAQAALTAVSSHQRA